MSNYGDKKARKLSLDIKRSILLARFIEEWGQPVNRTISTEKLNNNSIEVYEFSGREANVSRFVTIGISEHQTLQNQSIDWELLFCLPNDLGGAQNADVVNYLLDIAIYTLRPDICLGVGSIIPESRLAPLAWTTKAVLFDEARGEPEDMVSFHVGKQNIELLWVIPLVQEELQHIKTQGLGSFDDVSNNCDTALIDVNRSSLV
jgi:hypothetical protein